MSGPAQLLVSNTRTDPILDNLIDEFAKKLQTGEPVDLETFVREHPERAEELRRLLPAMQVLAELGRSALEGSVAETSSRSALDPVLGELGDFRIVREVGRGGMGIVYEAVQISLGRRVALKVLPLAAALDAKQLQRFKNEAQAAAGLHHSNIVPVFAVGSARGVHFYAMQFIDGQTLAALIHEQRQRSDPSAGPAAASTPRPGAALSTEPSHRDPAFLRTVANLGVQAAEALEYAHQLGVVHRDIKPANLLVDGRGNLWVTDFGLAHFQCQSGLTLSGDLLGTLRYMSPEQAHTRPSPVDHRTDIYSLGATLYELLTMRPPIPGHERQELLARLPFEEPVPPRRLNRAVPADLETIVLKALAKEPAERYGSAQEMADDLRRFLEGRPIQARRPTMTQRVVKWGRRHGRLVAGLAGMMFITMVAAVLSTILIWQEKSLREEAYEAEARQRREAEAKWQYARQAVDQMYLEADELMVHGVQQERLQQFLHKALNFYEEFARDKSAQPQAQLAASQAYHRVGEIQDKLGQYSKSEKAYQQAIALLERLDPAIVGKAEYQFALALNHKGLFKLACTTSRLRDAETALRQALALLTRLADTLPQSSEYRIHLIECHCCLAELHYVAGRHREVGQAFHHTLGLLKQLPADFSKVPVHALSARVYDSLGHWLWCKGQRQEAETAYGHARDCLEPLLTLCPTALQYRLKLASVYSKLGHLLAVAGKFPEAIKACQQAIAFQEKLAREFPAAPHHRGDLAAYYNQLGVVFCRAGQLAQAEAAYGQAITLLKQLTADFPAAPNHRMQLAASQGNLANVYRASSRPKEAESAYRQALVLDTQLTRDFPDRPDYRHGLGRGYHSLGRLLGSTGRFPEAEQVLRQALTVYAKLAADFPYLPVDPKRDAPVQRKPATDLSFPGQPRLPEPVDPWTTDLLMRLETAPALPTDYRLQLAGCHNDLGILLTAMRRFPEAEKEYRQARDLFEKLAAAFPDFPDYRYHLVVCSRNLARALSGDHRHKEKAQILGRALTLQDKLVSDLPEEPLCRAQWVATLVDLALTLREQGKLSDAQRLLEKTVPRHLALKVIPPHSDARLSLRKRYFQLARVCVQLGRHREAAQAASEIGRLSADHWKGLYQAADVLAWCIPLAHKDAALSPVQRKDRMGTYVKQAQALVREARKRGKDDPACQNALAWLLANCPAAALRDTKQALALAKKAVQSEPQRANYWTTLGTAHYRAGAWQAAVTALEKSLDLEDQGNSYDWFFLAMAHWQLGNKEEAHRFYDLAVQTMAKTQPNNKELRLFCAEAADLLGLPPPVSAGQVEPSDPPQAP
jgi:serine/threonine protein kinase/Flp pilus assembly protein TadD